ncbi:MAG TPA: ATP-binding protein, partial [Armatimonadota bacterium]|nr:ATP-binding protein [Armatimonadota bacterium]
MLLRFRVENHRSLRDEQELSLIASSLKDLPENAASVEGIQEEVLRAAVIYGPNASGKTNLCDAVNYLTSAVLESQRAWKPDGGVRRFPFILDPDFAEKPSLYEVDLLLDGVRYQYGFTADSSKILEEWLYAFPNRKRQTWFTRDTSQDRPIRPGKALAGTKGIEAFTRDNSLFLSAAAQSNHRMLKPIYDWFAQVHVVGSQIQRGSEDVTTAMLSEHAERIEAMLRAADLGIVGMEWKESVPETRPESSYASSLSLVRERGLLSKSAAPHISDLQRVVTFAHQSGSRGYEVALPLQEESSGTRAWFALLGPLLKTLESGGLLLVDELDTSLHTTLALEVIRLFNDGARNPRNAQLVFNAHDTNLLSDGVLRRDQIWFTEKDEEGGTHLYPLTDFKPRQHENLERGYLQGRYGAV